MDKLFSYTVETCPQQVDIVETPLFSLLYVFPHTIISYIYKLIGLYLISYNGCIFKYAKDTSFVKNMIIDTNPAHH